MKPRQRIAVLAAFLQMSTLLPQMPVQTFAEELPAETVQTETIAPETTAFTEASESLTETIVFTESTEESTAFTETTADPTEPLPTDATDPTETTETTIWTEPTETTEPSETTSWTETTETTQDTTEPLSPEQLTEAFVARLYSVMLGRTPDPTGLSNWTQKLLSGEETAAEVIRGFVFSQEYLNKNTSNEEYVTMLYHTLMNREPDEAGLASWCEKASMCSRTFLLRGFVQSSEFSALCESYAVQRGNILLTENRDRHPGMTGYITNLYRESLGREPDSAGLNNWTGLVLDGDKTLSEVILNFLGSTEFMEKNAENADYVASLYPCILGRQPDSAGLANWVNQMECGKTRFAIYLGMVKSTEFQELCTKYGIADYVTDLGGIGSAMQVKQSCLVYRQPSYSAGNRGYVYGNQILTVTGISGDWFKVAFMDGMGYIHKDKLTKYDSSGIKVLPVTNIPQCSTLGGDSLPTGCEVTSLAVLMQYLGFADATKNHLADVHMPRGPIGSTDPNYAFIGSPRTSYSYGAYAGVMLRTAENYFNANTITDYAVNDLTGAELTDLYAQVDAGNPVLVWYTMNCTARRTYGATWIFTRGQQWTQPGTGTYSFTWRNSEHCSVLVGYNKTKNTVILADVWANSGAATGALTEYSVSAFLSAYNWLGNQAVTITKNAAEPDMDVSTETE